MVKIYNELSNYQNIPRDVVFDKTLSDRARFVYVFMACKPAGWYFFLGSMAYELGYSVDTLRKYINELVASGWIIKGGQQNKGGKFGAVEYTIKATKITDTENYRHGENTAQYNNIDCKHNTDNNKEKIKELKEKSDTLFEECWKAYNRKGSKKKALMYWAKLSCEEKASVLQHIKAYVSSRERQFCKDFERYLRDKTFIDVVSRGGEILFDPTMYESGKYMPQGDDIWFNESTKSYWTTHHFYDGVIQDGYNDNNRPDGAEITLNNARGTIRWSSAFVKWEHVTK